MQIRVVECKPALVGEGTQALVLACSERGCQGEPEARVLMRLKLPAGATVQDARDMALRYLDVA